MTTIPQPTRADESIPNSRWVARTWLSRLVRFLIWLVPVLLSLLVIWFAARTWPPSELGVSVIGWWALFCAIAMAVLVFTDRIARRFLPLSALLRMALVFPDKAPSRFGAALRSGTPAKLIKRNPPSSDALMGLVRAISHHDRATRGHSERVRAYSQLIGQELNLDERDLDRLSWAAMLHDVGKLDVSPAILNKKGRPDETEWDELRTHPSKAPRYLVGFEHWMGDFGRAASEHHERWDGNGYPAGLAGEDIHVAGRVVAVADAYDVMTSVRSYKKSMPTAVAREEIARNAGSQFDPEAVRAFLNVGIGQVNTKWGAFSWLTQIPDMVSRAPAAALVAAIAVGAMMGIIDPGRAEVDDDVTVVEQAQDIDAEPVVEPTATPTLTPVPTVEPNAVAGSGDGSGSGGDGSGDGSGDGGDGGDGDGSGDDDSDDEDDSDTDSEDESNDEDEADSAPGDEGAAEEPAPTPTLPATLTTDTAQPAAPPRPSATPTPDVATPATPEPVPTFAAAFDLLGGTPTPIPTPDLFGPPAPDPQQPLPPRLPRPTATPIPTPTPVPTSTPLPTPTPIPTPTPQPTATPVPTPTPQPTATPVPTPTPQPTATPVPTPTPEPTPTPVPPTEVTFYDNVNFNGNSFVVGVGSYAWPFIRDDAEPGVSWNDRIRSIQIPPGLQVLACRHGLVPVLPEDCQVFIGDVADLPGPPINQAGSFDNNISSFVISLIP